MANIDLVPTGNGYITQWTTFGGGGRPMSVQTNDGNASYVWVARVNAYTDAYTVDPMPGAAGVITNVQSGWMVMKSGTGSNSNIRNGLRYGGSNAWGTLGTGYSTSYSNYLPTNHPTPPGGGKWTSVKVNASQVLIYNNGDAPDNSIRVTKCSLYVTYTLQVGGLLMLMSRILPLLGGNIVLHHMARLRAELWRATGGRYEILADEEAALFRDLQAWKRPAFAF